jgi:hypothetical protein
MSDLSAIEHEYQIVSYIVGRWAYPDAERSIRMNGAICKQLLASAPLVTLTAIAAGQILAAIYSVVLHYATPVSRSMGSA